MKKFLTLILFLFLSIEITYANPFIDLSTPMGRDVNNVKTCGEGSGAIVLDSALFLSNNPAKFIEDIDGNLSFDSDVVKVGLFLVDTFSTDGDVFVYTDCNTESAYDRELNDAINQTIISNIQTLQPVEYFNFKPYKFEIINIDIQDPYGPSYKIDNVGCLNTIQQYSANYDLIVAPVSCIYSGRSWTVARSGVKLPLDSGLDYVEFYSRGEILESLISSKNNQAIEYQKLVESSPDSISWLDIPPADGDDYGSTCVIEGITNIQADAAIIDRWEGNYVPIYFSDINSLFVEVTQKKEYNCNDLLLTLADKEKLKKALDRKTIKYEDDKTIIKEEVLTIQTIDKFYDKIPIPDEKFYNFFADYGYDDVLFEKLLKNNIDSKVKLDNYIANAQIETPDYSLDTNQDIYDYLSLEEEASLRGLPVSVLIDERKRLIQEAEVEAAEQDRIARQEYLRDYPFYAKISCDLFGNETALAVCFMGEYNDTTITLNTNNQSREKKFYNLTDLGEYEGQTLVIDLPRNFNLSAQNASDDATLSVKIYDQNTHELLQVDEAGTLYGIASSYNYN